MSGGALDDFAEWRNVSTVEQLRLLAAENSRSYSPEAIKCLLEAADRLEEANRKVKACDYLLAGDNSEESFLRAYHKKNPRGQAMTEQELHKELLQVLKEHGEVWVAITEDKVLVTEDKVPCSYQAYITLFNFERVAQIAMLNLS